MYVCSCLNWDLLDVTNKKDKLNPGAKKMGKKNFPREIWDGNLHLQALL